MHVSALGLLLVSAALGAAPLAAQPVGGRSELYPLYFELQSAVGPTYLSVVQPGDWLDALAVVRIPNEGAPAPAGPFTVAFFLSDDRYLSPDDTELHRWRVPGLARGEQAIYSLPPSVVVPDVPLGNYSVLMVVDVDDEVAETEDNDQSNVDYFRINVGGVYYQSPNLISASGGDGLDEESVLPGDNVSIQYGVLNLTYGQPSGPFVVGYQLVRFGSLAPPLLLETEEFSSLEPEEDEFEFEQLTIPDNTPPGLYLIRTAFDLTNVVTEWDEDNRPGYFLMVEDPLGRPLLSAGTDNILRLPRTLTEGTEIYVHGRVANRGASAAPALDVGVVLSRDAAFSPDDVVIGRVPSPPVPAATGSVSGSGVTLSGTITVPPGVTPGSYAFILVPDIDNDLGLPPGMRQHYGFQYVTVPGVVATDEPPAAAFTLHTPHPNPTTGASRISFALPAPSEARLTVYDVLGREVTVVSSGSFAAGSHSRDVPAGLAPGLYVLRLGVAGRVLTQPFTVVR